MPISKHAKAQRRLRGTTYKLVRRGYLERQAEEQQEEENEKQNHIADEFDDDTDKFVSEGKNRQNTTGYDFVSADGESMQQRIAQQQKIQKNQKNQPFHPQNQHRNGGPNEWVAEGELHKAYKNIRAAGRGRKTVSFGDDDGNPFATGDAYDLGEDAAYWEEEEEGEEGEWENNDEDFYNDEEEEDGEAYEDGEWVDDDADFDEIFGEAEGDEGENLLVRDPLRSQRHQQPSTKGKSVKFNFNAVNGNSTAAASSSPAKNDVDEFAEKESPEFPTASSAPSSSGMLLSRGGKRGRRLEGGTVRIDGEDDTDEIDEIDEIDETAAVAFDRQYEEDAWENTRRSGKKGKANAAFNGSSNHKSNAQYSGEKNADDNNNDNDDDADEKLFEDEMDCEVTDEFLRQLVFGTGPAGAAATADGNDDGDVDDGDFFDGANPPPGMDGEVWNLLTEEERLGVLESHRTGTTRRRQQPPQTRFRSGDVAVDDSDPDHRMLDAEEGIFYPQHDAKDRRALENQFDAMMAEFEGDMPINDFFAQDADGNSTGVQFTDPRSMGALSIDKYLSSLEEFVENRAGVDMEKNEPWKNKGLLTQLKFLAHNAGAFDYNEKEHGVFLTNNMSEKQRKFAEAFRSETETMKREAKLRVLKRMLENRRRKEAGLPSLEEEEERADIARAIANGGDFSFMEEVDLRDDGEDDDDDEAVEETAQMRKERKSHNKNNEKKFDIIEVKNRGCREDRLDCETAVSAYSSYYNQPNVIHAPGPRRGQDKLKRHKKRLVESSDAAVADIDDISDGDEASESAITNTPAVSYVRSKSETKEEKKLRRQAVKQQQRERRQEKSNLKKAYKDVEKEETARVATSQNAKRTIKFM